MQKDPIITKSFTVNSDGTWTIRIVVNTMDTLPFPEDDVLEQEHAQSMLNDLDELYMAIASSANYDIQGLLVDIVYYWGTIRSNKCVLLVNNHPSKCHKYNCGRTYDVLLATKWKRDNPKDKIPTAASSSTNFA